MQADDGNVGVIVDPWGDHVILKKWDRIELNLTPAPVETEGWGE